MCVCMDIRDSLLLFIYIFLLYRSPNDSSSYGHHDSNSCGKPSYPLNTDPFDINSHDNILTLAQMEYDDFILFYVYTFAK